ncbi:hypothetical protein HYR99_07255 [Candidatus Poribacteria bacterium]|nr:hypothetical protein [Candidatus Poribacteria bacterium]
MGNPKPQSVLGVRTPKIGVDKATPKRYNDDIPKQVDTMKFSIIIN